MKTLSFSPAPVSAMGYPALDLKVAHTRNRTYVPEFGNCRFDRRDQILRTGSNHSSDLLPKADLRLRFDGTRPSSGSNGMALRLGSAVDGTQAMQFNTCEFGAQFGDETEAPPSCRPKREATGRPRGLHDRERHHSMPGEMRATARHRTAIEASQSMLARTPSALKKRRYRRRRRDGMIAPHVQFNENEFAEALITAGILTEQQALRRDQLVREAEDIIAQFIVRWLRTKS